MWLVGGLEVLSEEDRRLIFKVSLVLELPKDSSSSLRSSKFLVLQILRNLCIS
jgi:hypothetical protein